MLTKIPFRDLFLMLIILLAYDLAETHTANETYRYATTISNSWLRGVNSKCSSTTFRATATTKNSLEGLKVTWKFGEQIH